MTKYYAACDLGAESGRVMVGELSKGKLSLMEVHRFPNVPVDNKTSLQWDIPQLYEEVLAGLRKVGGRGDDIAGVSCDSWGVDYVLFGKDGALIPPTYHYRDPRGETGMKHLLKLVPWESVYAETGIQQMPLNTIFQLAAEDPKRLRNAHHLLSIGDGFNFLLSGVAKMEVSMASTTQLYNPVAKDWSSKLLHALKLPANLLPPLTASGSVLGPLRPEIVKDTGLEETQVVASCTHDTAAAVAALPATGDDWAFLSSGTWSLMGIELKAPLINDRARELNFTNEIGYGHSVRLLKNILGLWLVQECKRYWTDREQDLDYGVLTHLAASSPPFESIINPADPRFASPGDMPEKIAAFCKETKQPVPKKPGQVIRCVLESLALFYRRTLHEIETLTGRKIQRLYLVGGGVKNSLLNHFTANALRIPVVIGPSEATSAGNVLVQALALGHLKSLDEARQVVRHSIPCETIQPHAVSWQVAYERLQKML